VASADLFTLHLTALPASSVVRRDRRLQLLIGGDDYGILGFREHVFTHNHSAVGRYMALAEQAFGTLVQRFLARPHGVRISSGHPDMVNAYLVRKTGGVSRGSLRVNVNEDIFLGYEMVAQGVEVGFTEFIFCGKGRDAEFGAASVFLRKLAEGCVMQLMSRQVADLYLTHLTAFQKISLFYGTLNHFFNIWLSDKATFLFCAMWLFFQLAGVTPMTLQNFGCYTGNAWILPLGVMHAIPMLVERKIEKTYLTWNDILMSVPFFSHQNRVTSYSFSMALQTRTGGYMASGRGLGNSPTPLVDIFLSFAISNFLPACQLITMVTLFCALGGSVIYLLWPLIAACCYITAPVLYNCKPTYMDTSKSFAAFWNWLYADDRLFDADTFDAIRSQDGNLDLAAKERLFGTRAGLEDQAPMSLFVQQWEGAAKGPTGMPVSLQTFWVYQWFSFLSRMDFQTTDLTANEAFGEVVWARLLASEARAASLEEIKTEYEDKGYHLSHGPLRPFLVYYCRAGVISLLPNEQKPTAVTVASEQLGTALLRVDHTGLESSRYGELACLLGRLTLRSAFWLVLPLGALLQRVPYPPYDRKHVLSYWAVTLVGFHLLYYSCKYLLAKAGPKAVLHAFALKALASVIFVVLWIAVLVDAEAIGQTVLFGFMLGVIIMGCVEVLLYCHHFRLRGAGLPADTRRFRRLGFIMWLSVFPGVTFYRYLFLAVGVCLTAFRMFLVVLRFFHTTWMFNSRAAGKLV
jgi:hypothetical protein